MASDNSGAVQTPKGVSDKMTTKVRVAIEPITPVVGAIIGGVDLRERLDADTVAKLRAAVLKHGALFFRDQDLTKAQTTAFLKNFGQLTLDPYSANYEVGVAEEEAVRDYETFNDNAKATQFWHVDSSHGEKPANFLSLRALILPESGGGDTCWGSLYAAYETLSQPVRDMIDRLEALHSDYRTYPLMDKAYLDRLNKGLSNIHPVVRVHPETGRKALLVNPLWTKMIVGVSEVESNHILNMLYTHASQPEFTMRWRWRVNDLVLWDNRSFQHYAVRDYHGRRTLEKGIIAGERPYGPTG
jgi:alpha-ketoglutarate-dependent taurine dioxygenase